MKSGAGQHAAALLVMLAAACGGTGNPTGLPTTTVHPTAVPPATTTEPPVTAPSPLPSAGEQLFGDFGTVVTLHTSTSGGGGRPLLDWQQVAGADHYGLYVYAPDGRIHWAWTGRETSIHVGGEPQLREGAPGPRITEGMSWAVVAYDADMLPITTSEIRPISP